MADFDFGDVDTDSTEDEFDIDGIGVARSGFASKEDLEGHVLVVTVTGQRGESPSKNGTTFPWIEGNVTVLLPRDEKRFDKQSDLIDELPHEFLKFRFSGVHLVGALERPFKAWADKQAGRTPKGGTSVLLKFARERKGRNGNSPAWLIEEITPEEIAAAKAVISGMR